MLTELARRQAKRSALARDMAALRRLAGHPGAYTAQPRPSPQDSREAHA